APSSNITLHKTSNPFLVKKDKVDSHSTSSSLKPLNNVANSHFPSRLNPPRKDKAKDEELGILKKVEINPSLLSAVQQIPKYVKFLKELLYKEDRHFDKENNIVCQNVHELIKKDMPKESLDPGKPSMKTSKAIIDVDKGSLSVEFGGDMISFNIDESTKYPWRTFLSTTLILSNLFP
ncbi:hypothetical protein Csa_023688, partial [Cucumis sativus]